VRAYVMRTHVMRYDTCHSSMAHYTGQLDASQARKRALKSRKRSIRVRPAMQVINHILQIPFNLRP
jgi:hypothetical protein